MKLKRVQVAGFPLFMEIDKKIQKSNGNYRIEGRMPLYKEDKQVGTLEFVAPNVDLENGLILADEKEEYYEISKRLD